MPTLQDRVLVAGLVYVAAGIAYIPVPFPCRLEDARVAVSQAIAGASGITTIKKIAAAGGAAVNVGTITTPIAGSFIGKSTAAVLSGTEASRNFAAGDTLVLDYNGGNTTAGTTANFAVTLRG